MAPSIEALAENTLWSQFQEDCLVLNIYTPETRAEDALRGYPVMFWIHGGAFKSGELAADRRALTPIQYSTDTNAGAKPPQARGTRTTALSWRDRVTHRRVTRLPIHTNICHKF